MKLHELGLQNVCLLESFDSPGNTTVIMIKTPACATLRLPCDYAGDFARTSSGTELIRVLLFSRSRLFVYSYSAADAQVYAVLTLGCNKIPEFEFNDCKLSCGKIARTPSAQLDSPRVLMYILMIYINRIYFFIYVTFLVSNSNVRVAHAFQSSFFPSVWCSPSSPSPSASDSVVSSPDGLVMAEILAAGALTDRQLGNLAATPSIYPSARRISPVLFDVLNTSPLSFCERHNVRVHSWSPEVHPGAGCAQPGRVNIDVGEEEGLCDACAIQ